MQILTEWSLVAVPVHEGPNSEGSDGLYYLYSDSTLGLDHFSRVRNNKRPVKDDRIHFQLILMVMLRMFQGMLLSGQSEVGLKYKNILRC